MSMSLRNWVKLIKIFNSHSLLWEWIMNGMEWDYYKRVELKFSYACEQGRSQDFLGLAPIAPPPWLLLCMSKRSVITDTDYIQHHTFLSRTQSVTFKRLKIIKKKILLKIFFLDFYKKFVIPVDMVAFTDYSLLYLRTIGLGGGKTDAAGGGVAVGMFEASEGIVTGDILFRAFLF